MRALRLACLPLLAARASYFSDLRAIDLASFYERGHADGLWGPHPLSPVPSVPDGPPLLSGGAERGSGFWSLDFTWNDTVAYVSVDPAETAPSTDALSDAVFGVSHVTRGDAAAGRGPLLGVNVSVERCMVVSDASAPGGVSTAWVSVSAGTARGAHGPPPSASGIPAGGGSARPDHLTLGGAHGGFLRIPVATLWTWVQHCPLPQCSYSVAHGPPTALSAAGHAVDADAVLRALPAELRGDGVFASTAYAAGKDAAVVWGDVGRMAGLAAVTAAAGSQAAAAASAAAPPSTPADASAAALAANLPAFARTPSRDILRGFYSALRARASAWVNPPPQRASPAARTDAWTCNPGSVRVVTVEWRLPATRFTLLARLALDNDGWLWDYNKALSLATTGWDRYLHDLTSQGLANLHGDGCHVRAAPGSPTADDKVLIPPSSAQRVRSPASWVALATDAMRYVSAADAAAGCLAPGCTDFTSREGTPGGAPVIPPCAANATFFTLKHWWPGYEQAVVGGAPGIVSFVIAPEPPTNFMHRVFGPGWVIVAYMIFASSVIFIHATLTCLSEDRLRKRFDANSKKRREERRARGESNVSQGSQGSKGQ